MKEMYNMYFVPKKVICIMHACMYVYHMAPNTSRDASPSLVKILNSCFCCIRAICFSNMKTIRAFQLYLLNHRI